MQTFFRLKSWLLHFLLEIDEYSIHSPFLFNFYNDCINKSRHESADAKIESLRKSSIRDSTLINTGEWGSSVEKGHRTHSIGKIARSGITRVEFSLLYREIIRYFNFTTVFELGTSIGINTLYLADSSPQCSVYTFEGNPDLIRYAVKNFKEAAAPNIRIIEGDIGEQLPITIDSGLKPQFVFFDANHRYEPTVKYFNMLNHARTRNAVFVFDDIHWSREMNRAWNDIRKHEDVKIDLDLFQAGIIIFGSRLPKLSAKLVFN